MTETLKVILSIGLPSCRLFTTFWFLAFPIYDFIAAPLKVYDLIRSNQLAYCINALMTSDLGPRCLLKEETAERKIIHSMQRFNTKRFQNIRNVTGALKMYVSEIKFSGKEHICDLCSHDNAKDSSGFTGGEGG